MESSCLAPWLWLQGRVLYFGRRVPTMELGRWVACARVYSGSHRPRLPPRGRAALGPPAGSWGGLQRAALRLRVLGWNACTRRCAAAGAKYIPGVCWQRAPHPHRRLGPELQGGTDASNKHRCLPCTEHLGVRGAPQKLSRLVSSAARASGEGAVAPSPDMGHPPCGRPPCPRSQGC